MKVIMIKGKAKPQYTVFYPADKQIAELPENVQLGIQALGDIFHSEERDLTHATDPASREIIERIQHIGAHLAET